MIVRQARTMIKIYVISKKKNKFKTTQDRRHERVPTDIETNEFLKLDLGHQLCPDA